MIQIASMVTVLGETKPRVKNIMTLGSCASIVGAEVGWHEIRFTIAHPVLLVSPITATSTFPTQQQHALHRIRR